MYIALVFVLNTATTNSFWEPVLILLRHSHQALNSLCVPQKKPAATLAQWFFSWSSWMRQMKRPWRSGSITTMAGQAAADVNADGTGTAANIALPEGAINFNMGTLVGSYASVARMLDEVDTVPGVKGVMLTFDDFIKGMDIFGTKVQPLMKTRAGK